MSLPLALSWARPGAAWALVLPLLLLLLVQRRARPPAAVIGTLALWRELPLASASAHHVRLRLPAWALAAALGLLCGALAWLGPRSAGGRAARTWIVVVDRSPSMGLPAAPLQPGAPPASRTRLDAALAAASEWLAQHAVSTDRVRWSATGRVALELMRDARPEPSWLAPDPDGVEPEWQLFDQAGSLWITDRRPDVRREHAGLFASGGAAVEGPIAADGRESVWWEHGELRKVARRAPLVVSVNAPAGAPLPPVLERALMAWCMARGFELVRGPSADALLVLERDAGNDPDETLVLARDGWRATGRGTALAAPRAVELAPDPRAEDWLIGTTSSGAELAVVRLQTGRIEVALSELSEPAGDPALFALSCARLFERAARRPPDVVPQAERVAAGDPITDPGAAPQALERAGTDWGPHVDAALALAAALCAAVAFLLRAR